jgi:hypothetical protein
VLALTTDTPTIPTENPMSLMSIVTKFARGREDRDEAKERLRNLPPYDVTLTECLRKNNNKIRIMLGEIEHLLDDVPDYYAISTRLKLLRDVLAWNLDSEREVICSYVRARVPHNPIAVELVDGRNEEAKRSAVLAKHFFGKYVGRIWDPDLKEQFGREYPLFAGAAIRHLADSERVLYAMYLPPNVLSHTTFVRPQPDSR